MTLRDAVLTQIDLQALAEEAGAQFNNRLASPCPLHGGDNPHAFNLFQGHDGYHALALLYQLPPRREQWQRH